MFLTVVPSAAAAEAADIPSLRISASAAKASSRSSSARLALRFRGRLGLLARFFLLRLIVLRTLAAARFIHFPCLRCLARVARDSVRPSGPLRVARGWLTLFASAA